MFWTSIDQPLKRITTGTSYNIWAIDPNNNLRYFDRKHHTGQWVYARDLPNQATAADVSVGFDGAVYALDSNGHGYHLHRNGHWSDSIGGNLRSIAVANEANVMCLIGQDRHNPFIALYQGIPNCWATSRAFKVGSKFSSMQVSMGTDGTAAWVDGNSGSVYLMWWPRPGRQIITIGTAGNFLGTKFKIVSVAQANSVYCVDEDDNIWDFHGDGHGTVYKKIIVGVPNADYEGGFEPVHLTGGSVVDFVHSDLNSGYMIYKKGDEYATYKLIPRHLSGKKKPHTLDDSFVEQGSTGAREEEDV